MVLRKHEIEQALHTEQQAINAGQLKEDNPLDLSDSFNEFCQACRRGDLKVCQEKIQEGININARDRFDYTPLILKASLCGHFEVVRVLLESGALCERDTFQGERCLYDALNDRIRNLLLSYDYSKSRDPLQPLAAHVTSLLSRDTPTTSDITLTADSKSFHLHKFLLSARSPYFATKLASAPDTTSWKVPPSVPIKSLEIAIRALYFEEVSAELGDDEEDQAILTGIDKLGRQLEISHIFDAVLESDRRLARQRKTQETERGRDQLEDWFETHVLAYKIEVEAHKADDIKWDRQNGIFADVLLCADEEDNDETEDRPFNTNGVDSSSQTTVSVGIPVGPTAKSRSPSRTGRKQSTLFPAHRAMLLRSEYFSAMFSSGFKEAQVSEHLPIVRVDCNPAVLSTILRFLYTETANFGLDQAIDILFAADLLFIEKLKVKAAMIISTLGNGDTSIVEGDKPRGETTLEDVVDIYDVVRAGWDTRVHRLEEFGARYIAYRLERYIDEEDFRELVKESAGRIQKRQETDTIELIDDIRYYLSERFRLRFEDAGIDELEDDNLHDIGTEKMLAGKIELMPQQDPDANLPSVTTNGDVPAGTGVIRTLDGDIAGDEFSQDALNYQILLGKIDGLLETLDLDA